MEARVSTHNHTTASVQKFIHKEGFTSPSEFMQVAMDDKVVPIVTDHDSVASLPELKKISEQKGWPFIAGIESSTVLGHVIFAGSYDDILNFQDRYTLNDNMSGQDAIHRIDKIRAEGDYVMVIPHLTDVLNTGAFSRDTGLALELAKRADYVESWNANNSMDGNYNTFRSAKILSENYGVRTLVGPDSHMSDILTKNLVVYDVDSFDEASIRYAMKMKKPKRFERVMNVDYDYLQRWVVKRAKESADHILDVIDKGHFTNEMHWYYRAGKIPGMRSLFKKMVKNALYGDSESKTLKLFSSVSRKGADMAQMSVFSNSPTQDYERLWRAVLDDKGFNAVEKVNMIDSRSFRQDYIGYLNRLLYENKVPQLGDMQFRRDI